MRRPAARYQNIVMDSARWNDIVLRDQPNIVLLHYQEKLLA